MRVVKLAAGLAVGYVLGARAGRETYEQIAATVRTVSGRPAEANPQSSPEPEAGVAVVSADVAADDRPTPAVVGDKPRRPRNRPKKAAARTTAAGSSGSSGSTGESSAMSTADLGLDSIPLEASEADVIEQKMPVVDRSDDPTDPSPVRETDAADAREQRRS